jgi:tetratricopeptide (TPR) repeat protein
MAEKVQNLYRTSSVQPPQPLPASRPIVRWTVRETLICILLVSFVVTGYFTVWKFRFVYFDDPGYVSENLDVLRGLPLFTNPEKFKASVYWAFTAFEQSNWHPLTWLSHMLDVQLYQQWQGGHHITNIILHSLSTLLLFGLFWRMTDKPWRSAAVAAMFAIHPMHVESVAWVAERKDVLSTFFGLLTLHAYVTYSARARFNGGSILFAGTLACFVGILGWLWYDQCFWYISQVILFQQHASRTVPNGYECLTTTGPILAAFATFFILAIGGIAGYAASSGRRRLLKYCGILLGYTLVGTVILASLWSSKSFEGGEAQKWTNYIGGAVLVLAAAGGVYAVTQGRSKVAIQCAVFAATVGALLIVLNWIQLMPPKSPAAPAWYNNPFQTAVERIWCCEFAVAIFVVFGSLAVDVVAGRRTNLGLFCIVFLLYVLGLLAKPMLVTLPFVMLLLDYWPLRRVDPPAASEEEKPSPAVAAVSADLRTARRRARERRRTTPAPAYAQAPSDWASQEPIRTIIRLVMLVVEKAPLFALGAISAVVTPIAQSHGGSMASANDLKVIFRVQNAIKSFSVYIGKMFWPGKMMSLHLIAQDEHGMPYVEPELFWLGLAIVLTLTAIAIAAFFLGRRYITFGWLWYFGLLVPVIGFVQVGEQRWADRYTYVSYVGLFVAIVWTIGDLLDRFPRWRPLLLTATAGGAVLVLSSWTSWTNFQIQTWRDVETHLVHALEVEPDNWNMLNNHGVYLWKEAQKNEQKRNELLTEGKSQEAMEYDKQVLYFKDAARKSWIHGITSRPTATDIHSNLGYAYSEAATQSQEVANQLQAAAAQLATANPEESKRKLEESKQKEEEAKQSLNRAEYHLGEAVRLKDISPRPHNNLGRVLLRRSQQFEMEANAAEAKGKTDPSEAAKVKPLRDQAKLKLDQALEQFERSVQLDPSLLEAHLNLGEVYTQLAAKDPAFYDKAKLHYRKILEFFDITNITDRDALANFSQAFFGLGRIALAQGNVDEAVKAMKQALVVNPNNMPAMDRLAQELFLHGSYRDGETIVRMWLSKLPPAARRQLAEQFGRRFEAEGKREQAIRAWGAMAWIFATGPEPQLRDPQAAIGIADSLVKMTKQQDPLALDTLAAALAINNQFPAAVQTAQTAINLATSQGNKALAEMITQRLACYQRQEPYVSKPDASDRP